MATEGMNGVQKAAILLIALGPEKSSQIFKHLKVEEFEELTLEIGESPSVKEKKKRRKQGIVGLIASNPNITVDMLSEKMGVNEKTIRRDLAELREQGIIEREGGDFGGHWVICRKRH